MSLLYVEGNVPDDKVTLFDPDTSPAISLTTTYIGQFPVIAVDYVELNNSPSEKYVSQEGTATRTFLVDWKDRWDFCKGMLGWSMPYREKIVETFPADATHPAPYTNEASAYGINRIIPQPYPVKIAPPGDGLDIDRDLFDDAITIKPWLYATSIDSMTGVGPIGLNNLGLFTTAQANYRYARVVVGYEKKSYSISRRKTEPSNYITTFVTPQTEAAKLPFGKMLWSDGTNTSGITGQLIKRNYTDVFMIWHGVPMIASDPSAWARYISSFLGTTNINPLTQFEFPEDTLLCVGAELQERQQIGGSKVCDITVRFKAIVLKSSALDAPDQGHNSNYKFHNKTYEPILLTLDGTPGGVRLLPQVPLENIFDPEKVFSENF